MKSGQKPQKQNRYAQNILKLRNRLGMTQVEFAEAIGLTQRGVQSIEYGTTENPGYEVLQKIADICEVDIRSIGSDSGPKPLPVKSFEAEKAKSIIDIIAALPALNQKQLTVVIRVIEDFGALESTSTR